jgi:ribosome-associated translation inhibitor RaiA
VSERLSEEQMRAVIEYAEHASLMAFAIDGEHVPIAAAIRQLIQERNEARGEADHLAVQVGVWTERCNKRTEHAARVYDGYDADIAKLRAALSEAVEDTKRLDWLEANKRSGLQVGMTNNYFWSLTAKSKTQPLREAIDAAIQSTERETRG